MCVFFFFRWSLFRGSHAFQNGISVFGLCIVKSCGSHVFQNIYNTHNAQKNVFSTRFLIIYFQKWKNTIMYLVWICFFFFFLKWSLFPGSHAFKNGMSVFGLCIVKSCGSYVFKNIYNNFIWHCYSKTENYFGCVLKLLNTLNWELWHKY